MNRGARVRWAWLLAALLIWVGCSQLVLRQGWQAELGPVVPHDSFPADCRLCHLGDDWHTLRPDFQFDHEAQTGVPLRGAHAHAQCLLCHNDRGPVQEFAMRGCRGCHVDPHQARLGNDCGLCHDEQNWRPNAQIAMHDRTRFPLVGAHAATACDRCHPGAVVGNFAGASVQCEHCHGGDLARATAPDHAANGWTRDCQRCHTPLSFAPASFAHPPGFPLTLGHGNRRCADCHAGGVFTGLSTACFSCHSDDYTAVQNPSHVASAFPTTCQTCHTTAAWRPASFPHTASFPLTGGHQRTCASCHTTPGVYTGLSPVCSSCHTGDYQAATNPPHAAIGMPMDCTRCHGTLAWRPSTFTHRFPRTGNHNVSCAECHRDPTNVAVFSCTHCHAHRQSEMADKHSGVGGYSWVSAACYQCHPNGRG